MKQASQKKRAPKSRITPARARAVAGEVIEARLAREAKRGPSAFQRALLAKLTSKTPPRPGVMQYITAPAIIDPEKVKTRRTKATKNLANKSVSARQSSKKPAR